MSEQPDRKGFELVWGFPCQVVLSFWFVGGSLFGAGKPFFVQSPCDGRRGCDRAITTRQYARLVGKWIASIGLDPSLFGTHSLGMAK